jgi:hypothetical protein
MYLMSGGNQKTAAVLAIKFNINENIEVMMHLRYICLCKLCRAII